MLRRPRYLHGEADPATGVKTIAWYNPAGQEQREQNWRDAQARVLGLMLDGGAGAATDETGSPPAVDRLLIVMNASAREVWFTLPNLGNAGWRCALDTARPDINDDATLFGPGERFALQARSLAVLKCVLSQAQTAG